MRNPTRRPGPGSMFLLGALTLAAAAMLGIRWYQAVGLPNLSPAVGLTSSVTTAILIAAAFTVGWRNSIRAGRAERAELAEQITELRKDLEEVEDRAWWSTPPPPPPQPQQPDGEDTIRLTPNVVPLHRNTYAKSS